MGVDGPEERGESTSIALKAVEDPRLRVIALERSLGGSEARNIGVRAATSKWVGFLDDDDQWLPGKIPAQLELAAQLDTEWPVVGCPVIARTPSVRDRIWPRRLYQSPQPMSEYLFLRSGWTYGAGLLQTSTLLVPRELLLRLPFTAGLKKHQDWDWLLRAAATPGVRIAMATEPLVIFHVEGERKSVGRLPDWRFSFECASRNRRLFTPRAFASFVATECAPQAARSGASPRERLRVFQALFLGQVPSLKTIALCLAFLLVPQQARRSFRDGVRGTRAALAAR